MPIDMPVNRLKRALRGGEVQIGLWSTLASPIAAEIVGGSGFDWVLLDTEHASSEITDVHRLLQALQGSASSAVVRPAWNDAVLLKRLLDIGAQSFVVPFVQTEEEARAAVAATRYPPRGVRGVATTTRATRYGRVKDYLARAGDEVCLMVQVETRAALANLEAIASVDGVDGLFIGPSDLSADLGHLGDNSHPEVTAAIGDAVARIVACGKVAGILAGVEADARHWIEAGCRFVGVGNDAGVLARQTEALAARFKSIPAAP